MDRSRVRNGVPRTRREVLRRFWALVPQCVTLEEAATRAGLGNGWRVFRQSGGVDPGLKEPTGRYLSFAERELIALWRAEGAGVREIARRLGRDPGTISRELRRNGRTHARGPASGGRVRHLPYLASVAQDRAELEALRPKERKLATTPALARCVQEKLTERWSPEQISAWLARHYPHDRSMQVSHETIYQSLYVQGRGGLKRELVTALRTGRAVRKPRRQNDQRRARVPAELLISARPAEVEDRAVPGHWEGDLIIGKGGKSQIATLVERASRFVLLQRIPYDRTAERVAIQLERAVRRLPAALYRSIAWDQGGEMAAHAKFTVATSIPVYFCAPHSPW